MGSLVYKPGKPNGLPGEDFPVNQGLALRMVNSFFHHFLVEFMVWLCYVGILQGMHQKNDGHLVKIRNI